MQEIFDENVFKKGIGRQINLPFLKAVSTAFKNIRVRFGRSFITIGGIFFSLTFLMSTFTNNVIAQSLLASGTDEVKFLLQPMAQEVQARQVWLISLSLLVCIIGIMNAMLTSVTERYREIGTWKCLGALDRFIVELFLLESTFQGLIGSIGGAILGFLFPLFVNIGKYGTQVIEVLPWLEILKYGAITIVIGLVLSIAGAIYPAYRATQMVPADAMRQEM
ncbi:hypothetical protein AUJ66_08295 [Candidatus Desantisbacteria bacterium CG1_02_38_46]|uniref:ABC3 transporter permease C-terminal domain-containing protein n=3 Tax=unclassified Candidatus Desantisiibacteriota TaxID=3106372 RepID=A0A2H9PDB5_9BACT|nr:MAG: hypothetical protein AUJ66_08295 [Candidatus Desantisbacteria bacterium CG1_02_38_46]PIU50907.1 MAG: hypothetical protein COS91_07275 [Candidatus Desantisbacteria bacterium CG07_land_8_20_14_0_80_39_15]PIZ16621.1 MAG: hypothetical protein COY51_02205 [Candidatus Desantisbacteria bacterium CG_4_10_14_0_8_um_filter_39_17]